MSPREILKQYWGFDDFRPGQEEIVTAVLNGHDVLALMPTGGGKSLCYQVPALANEGLCLVISPLIALMKDQVESLRKKNITAFAIYSGMSRKEVVNILKTATSSNCKFLYVSPERLETYLFKEYLPGIHVNLIAVDEAHCISQWGYDFRPPYLRIAELRNELPDVPVLALTASATPDVQQDICERLNQASLQHPSGSDLRHLSRKRKFPEGWKVFRQSFERANLSYSVFKVDSKINKLLEILKNVPGTNIVYCKSRRRTKEISELLQLHGIAADYYNAGLTADERTRKQDEWIRDKIRVIVCTNAFGMGIDKPDVRTVIHMDTPDSLENYYQEAGRAGRDRQKSYAVLLYDSSDLRELNELPDIRFPSPDTIKSVYQQLANYLQIPAGTGEGEYIDFSMSDFVRKFSISQLTAIYSLKCLEQEGWLAFNEQVFTPSSVQFSASRRSIEEIEIAQPQLEPVIKSLLRAYGGIVDFPVFISELVLANLLKKDKEDIKKELTELHQLGAIRYRPQKDNPQLLLLRNRVKNEDFAINPARYLFRKKQFQLRVQTMADYVIELSRCRSRITGNYFGDYSLKDCGICDNCLRKKGKSIGRTEFEQIRLLIENLAADHPIAIDELLIALGEMKKESVWTVLDFLQSENSIVMDEEGRILTRK